MVAILTVVLLLGIIFLLRSAQTRPQTTATPTSWAGYVSTGPNASPMWVEGSWAVPSVKGQCPSALVEDSFTWVGIGGWAASKSIAQIGTETDCEYGVPGYFVWYEFWPAPSIELGSLSPGDEVSARVTYTGGVFNLTLSDLTTGLSYNNFSADPNLARTSLEWVAEAPLEQPYSLGHRYPLTDFGNLTIDHAYVDRGKGVATASLAGNLTEVYIPPTNSSGGASPGALQGESFSIEWVGPSETHASDLFDNPGYEPIQLARAQAH